MAKVVKTLNMPDGTTMVILQGLDRFELEELVQVEPYWFGKVNEYPDGAKDLPKNYMALAEAVKDFGDKNGWWADNSDTNIFTRVLLGAPYNQQYAWLLYCGYYE